MSTPTLVARNEIHKSCKTFEAVVNYLNDYSEAATAIIGIQKKLARALRDAASAKATSEVPANALNASATVFDTLCEVDSKFAKFVDNECEGISTEVKRWFKRLAKEERTHDEKVANANDKIKQAGQNYEKKVKKNPADAAAEHARYINSLTTLGVETNQEKYNHSLMVTQRHEVTLFGLAACLSRVADSEWLRVCEGVRRISPNVGRVGEWRVLCEGNWLGPVPPPLPDVDESKRVDSDLTPNKVTSDDTMESVSDRLLATPVLQRTSRADTLYEQSPQYFSPPKSATPRQGTLVIPAEYEDSRDRSYSINSIASLGSFPVPPTHLPLPRLNADSLTANQLTDLQHVSRSSSSVQLPSQVSSTSDALSAAPPSLPAESRKDSATFLDFSSPPGSPPVPVHESPKSIVQSLASLNEAPLDGAQASKSSAIPDKQQTVVPSELRKPSIPHPRGGYIDDGDDHRTMNNGERTVGSAATIAPVKPALERSDTGQSKGGSVVAAIRDKYSRSIDSASPPPRDVPRLPQRVSDLASRYDPSTNTLSEQTAFRSPLPDSTRTPREMRQQDVAPAISRNSFSPPRSHNSEDSSADEITRRRQRIQELEELELREQEYALRMKEKEIRERARELEREQLELMNARQNRLKVDLTSDRARPLSIGRPDSLDVSTTPVQAHPYASSNTISPSSPRFTQRLSSQPPSPMVAQPLEQTNIRDAAVSPRMQSTGMRSEKPKGWMRRLSMPVIGNALGDSKKGVSSADVVPFYRNSLALPEEDGRLRNELVNGSKNRSVTSLIRR